VSSGSDMVKRTGASITDLVSQVKQVSGLIDGISRASREQESGIDQINCAVGQLDQITQQTSALVERGAGTSRALHDEADRLTQAVGTFKLELVA
jgi:methyl-accepting chemotaxis protein